MKKVCSLIFYKFLLMEFQLSFVFNKVEPKKMKKALSALPVDFLDIYGDAFNRSKLKGYECYMLAVKVLSWIYYSPVLLRIGELREALVIDDGDDYLEEENLLPPGKIIEVYEGLVVHEKSSSIVRFAYYIVQEFLRSNFSQHLQPVVVLGKTCLTCLNFKNFEEGPCIDELLKTRVQANEFGRYAA